MNPNFFRKYSDLITEAEAAAPGAAPAAPAAPAAAPAANQVQVTFINSGTGVTGQEAPQTVEKLGLDIGPGGAPVMYVRSPSYGDKLQANWDARNNRWVVDLD